jgi:alkylation response protein AidB-like acyl-CoA dehydrogenase
MVEKFKSDVRITTIYEGTSEIMEMTIGRDRWQHHLKTRGQHYHELGRRLEGVQSEHPKVGADVAALAAHALAEIMERARAKRLTRNQHVLFRIGELVSYVEGAAAFARHAVRAEIDQLNPKTPRRFAPAAVAAMARVFAREAAQRVAVDGMRWIIGAETAGDADVQSLETSAQLSKIYAAQAGLIEDMNQVGDALYERS